MMSIKQWMKLFQLGCIMNDYNRIKIVAPLFKEYVSRYFGNDVIAIYFYGSAVCGDFKKQSDYDFIVLLKAIDENTECVK